MLFINIRFVIYLILYHKVYIIIIITKPLHISFITQLPYPNVLLPLFYFHVKTLYRNFNPLTKKFIHIYFDNTPSSSPESSW